MLIDWNFKKLGKILKAVTKEKNKQDVKINGFSIDTRSIKKGEIFCALKGNNHDGHDYLNQAYNNGASCLMLSDTNKYIPNIPYIAVENVLESIEKIAEKTRKSINTGFIAITGSVGKTGTKEMIKSALESVGKTFANKGSYNNHIGVPLSMSNTPNDSKYCIYELGMNRIGEIKKLSNLVSPKVGIITAIENSHLKGLKTLENIADAKSELLNNIQKDGCFIYNADTNFSDQLEKKAKKLKIKTIISYGKTSEANIKFLGKIRYKNKYLIKAKYFNQEITWKMPDLAEHWYINSLCILGIAKYYNLNLNSLLKGLENFELPSGRGNIIHAQKWSKKFFIIDDSYNSSPASLEASLKKFNELHCKGKKIAILGDMNELGEKSENFHLDMKRVIENTNIDKIFTIGKYMRVLYRALSPSMEKEHFNNILKLEQILKKILRSNDMLLVKGSNSVGLHLLVKKIAGAKNDL